MTSSSPREVAQLHRLQALRREVQKRSDDYENRAAKASTFDRARLAGAFGLAREALHVARVLEMALADEATRPST